MFFLRRCAAVLVVLTLLFSDAVHIVTLELLPSTIPRAQALTGDYSIFTNTSNVTEVTSGGYDIEWDTPLVENGNISLQPDGSSIDLTEGGKYLVLYNAWTEKGTSTGSNRRSFLSNLALNGSPIEYGYAGGYIRDAGGEDVAAYAAGGAIIEAVAGQDLEVQITRDDTNPSAESLMRAGTNGVSVLKLNDNFDYLRIYRDVRSADVSGNTSFTDIAFTASDEVDTGSFGFIASSTASDITLKGASGKKFLVTANIKLEQDAGSTARQNYELRLTLDGVEIPGTRSTAYLRGDQDSHGAVDGVIVYTGIIEKTSASNQTLNFEMRRESVNGANTDIAAGQTAVSMVALPSSANYVMLTSTTSAQTLAVSQTPFTWNEHVSLDGSAFSHSTTTNNSRITIDEAGDYLFFSTTYTDRTSSSDRNVPRIQWRLDGASVVAYGGHGSFNRGVEASGGDTFTSGSSGGVLLSGLTSAQYLELLHSDETGDSPNAQFSPHRVALQGVDLASLSAIDTIVSVENAQIATTSPGTANISLAGDFVITENSGSRNLTSVTLTESGTVNAQDGLDNIKLYYDLDTSFPYDCASESYGGGEAQFGATDTDGFTAVNGTVLFSGSVEVTTTKTFCGYVVLDIGASTTDGDTIVVSIDDPTGDIVTTGGGTVGPAVAVGDDSATMIEDPEITLAHYHWRNDDGSETGASSATEGVEDTPAFNLSTTTPQRLRMSVYAAGTGQATMNFRLEYALKAGACSAATEWTEVGDTGAAWDLFDSSNFNNGEDTTNISEAAGGVSDPAISFITPNGALLDTTAESGSLTISEGELEAVGEYGTVTNTNGATTTVNLSHTYTNPVVVASVRYNRSTDVFRTARVTAKTSSSFDILTYDEGGDANSGSTVVDYLVMEAGTWDIQDGAGTRQVIATTTAGITDVAGGGSYGQLPGVQQSWPSAFSSDPVVIATISSYNSTDWMMPHIGDGVSAATQQSMAPPTATNFSTYLGQSHVTAGVQNEDIDVIAFESGHGTNNGVEYDAVVGPDGVVSHIPATVSFSDTFSSGAPGVTLVMQGAEQGGNGATALRDTSTAISASAVSVALDEEGNPSDRAHTQEQIMIIAFEGSSGTLYTNDIVNRNFAELEYSIQATENSIEGVGYCFRLSDAGTPLRNYSVYAEAALNSDVTVTATGTQMASVDASSSGNYLGGTFVISDNVATRTVESITVREFGSIDAAEGLANIELYYENDTTAPYDCVSESYDGGELQFGSTDNDGFSAANGTSTFTDSVEISTTSPLCVYVVADVTASTTDGQTIEIEVFNPAGDVIVSEGSVGPGSTIGITGSTSVNAPNLSQYAYHWRSNDGDETGASSQTGGIENTPISDVQRGSISRLRLLVANTGGATSSATQYRLEYGTKGASCAAVGVWRDVDVGSAFDMASTSQLVDGNDTTDIATSTGGTDAPPGSSFVSPNGGQKENTSQTSAISLEQNEFTELEFAITPTNQSAYETAYCFRVTAAGTALPTYAQYAELTTQVQQDFFVQRGVATISTTSLTLRAGIDYTAPASTTAAFVRITNTHHTGAGEDQDDDENNTPDGVTAYIEDQSDLTSSFTLTRPSDTANSVNTRVNWEIVEYIGLIGADNEMIVRDTGSVTFGATSLSATGSAVTGIADDSDVVVFITGQYNPSASELEYNESLATSAWYATTSEPVFTRGDADSIATRVSYAVVEYTGANWNIQRVEHNYTNANVTENEPIVSVGSLSRTFLHTQKRVENDPATTENGLHDIGHQVWLSSIGAVSFFLQGPSDIVSTPAQHYSVAWVIENYQTGDGAMIVYRSSGQLNNDETAGEPRTNVVSIGGTLTSVSNGSIWVNNESTGAGQAFPRPMLAPRIISTTQYELWRSDTGQFQTYRTEVVEWPVAELSIRQDYYRLYVDNDAITPTDPWPVGVNDLGENEAMTDLDEPLGQGERVRIRMTVFVNNTSMVADSQAFKLQFGRRDTTCSAIVSWTDVGAPGSGEIWRGYDGTPADGTPLATTSLLLSVADRAGSYEEANDSVVNPYTVDIGESAEYDWVIEHNGALQKSSYCFRMVEADDTLLAGYNTYPTVRTSGYIPVTENWRWYDDEGSETPEIPLAGENIAPTDIGIGDIIKLRIVTTEIEGALGENIKFNLQYSEDATFSDGGTTLTATSSCTGGTLWCYADGVDNDNDTIATTTLSGADSCVAGVGSGCGMHNEASGNSGPFDHAALASAEQEFTLQHDGARTNAVYYFRLVDATNGVNVLASSSYPSLVTAGGSLDFSVSGVGNGVSVEGITTDATSTPTSLSFGSPTFNAEYEVAHSLSVTTNATQGYHVFVQFDQPPMNIYGSELQSVTGTNASPSGWSTGCGAGAASCVGYHAGDDTLADGSTRFAPSDTYAGIPQTLEEVMYSSIPETSDQTSIVYKLEVSEQHPAGDYEATVSYIAMPIF